MDVNFEQLLAKHNQEFKDAEVYNDWMPDDGEYIVTVLKQDEGSTSKDGVEILWWKLIGRIEDVQNEKLNGKEFTVGYYTSKAYGILKGAARTISGNSELDDLAEAHEALANTIGTVLRVKVQTKPGKGANAGREFTNCYIQEVLNTEIVEEGEVPVDAAEPVEVAVEQEASVEVATVAPPTV